MTVSTFSELNLHQAIQQAINDEGYTTPTPIQAQTIPQLLEGRDVLGCAQTGTGKTAAFALPILHQLGSSQRKSIPKTPRALILAPTRELAAQIGESLATYGRHLKLRVAVVFGGVSQFHQVRVLARGVHILVATPGRLLDLMNQGHIHLNALETFVLDEADRMLDMGFFPDIKRIIKQLPAQRQSMYFSATLNPRILELAQELLTDPVAVTVSPPSSTVELIEQRVIHTERGNKKALLVQVLQRPGVDRVVVFTRTKRGADVVCQHLSRSGFTAEAIHGNKSQNARQRILEQFKRNRVQVLVATDLAARGLDIDGISHVVNFELPMEPESYVHRIGRTGRAGAAGMAISLCDGGERSDLRAIERVIGIKIAVDEELSLPVQEPTRESSEGGRRPRPERGRRPQRSQFGDRRRSAPRGEGISERSPRQDRPERRRFDEERPALDQRERPRRPDRGSAPALADGRERVQYDRRPHHPDRPVDRQRPASDRDRRRTTAPDRTGTTSEHRERSERHSSSDARSEFRQSSERRQSHSTPSGRPPRRKRFRPAPTGQ